MKFATQIVSEILALRRAIPKRAIQFGRVACLTITLLAINAHAEQSQQIGPFEVHYIAFPTTFLSPEIARQYDIVRGKDRALVNISILDADGQAVAASISGTMKNLPGQILPLDFVEVREGDALYYLASARYTDQEIVRFDIEFTPALDPSSRSYRLEFQQKLYWER